MSITQRDYTLLKGLRDCGLAFISASEAEDAMRLQSEGLVEVWQISTGFSAWKLSEKGAARIESAMASLEAII